MGRCGPRRVGREDGVGRFDGQLGSAHASSASPSRRPSRVLMAISQAESALGIAVHAILLAIGQLIAFDIERYHSRVDLKVVPPLCPVAISPSDVSHAAELIDRARVPTE